MSEAASVSARVRHEHPPPTQDSPAPKGRGSLRRVRTLREHIGNPRAISYMNVHHSESSSVSTAAAILWDRPLGDAKREVIFFPGYKSRYHSVSPG